MMQIFTIILIITSVTLIHGQEKNKPAEPNSQVCYEYVGCFSNSYPHNNTANYLPVSPDVIQTRFVLFTPQNRDNRHYLSYKDSNTIRNSKFNRNLPLKIIVHGFSSSLEEGWIDEMKNELLNVENLNVIVVGWENGCKFPNYVEAATNIRTVAKELNLLMTSIETIFGITDFDIHCIGHSLGAHLCGLSAQDSEIKFSRISALDPAGPFFEGVDRRSRVDTSDANFVDVIHTNGGLLTQSRFGMIMPCGHIDFYVNGGVSQPGCPGLFQIIINCLGNLENCKGDPSKDIGCSHNRAYKLYIESIKSSCSFRSHSCENADKYENGHCIPCEQDGCPVMGYYANSFSSTGPHYLLTADSSPYCAKQYLFEMSINRNSPKTAGEITLSLNNGPTMSVIPQNTDFNQNTKIGHVFISENNYKGNVNAKMQFKRKFKFGNNPDAETFNVDKIRVVNLDSGDVMSTCQRGYAWTDKQYIETTLDGRDCQP